MKNPTIITGDDIASYLPPSFSPEQRIKSIWLIGQVHLHIRQVLPIAFRYDGADRIAAPVSLYLQHRTRRQSANITHPTRGYRHQMSAESAWARRAVGFDGFELMKWQDDGEWWKSYHIDKIDNLELLNQEQVVEVFWNSGLNKIDYGAREIPGFINKWNYYFRRIVIERVGTYDLKIPTHFYK